MSRIVVVTGASSGIGHATVRELISKGDVVVMAARQLEKLNEVAKEFPVAQIETRALDVTDARAVQELARDVRAKHGRLDVWINDAGVFAIGSFTEVPLEDHRQVIETNLIGTMNGSYAALKIFREQARGVLINVASVSSQLPVPAMAAYNASKYGIRGLSLTLRTDLAVDKLKDIHVCLVNPAVVDTPAFDHAANYSGKNLKLSMPMTTAENVAHAIVGLIDHPQAEIYVGPLASVGAWAAAIFPSVVAKVLTWGSSSLYFGDKDQAASGGNLKSPGPKSKSGSHTTDGGWKHGKSST